MNYNHNNFNGYGNDNFYVQGEPDGVTLRAAKLASSAKTMGIISLVISIFCCPLVSLIMGFIAIARARTARVMLGGDLPEGKTGRICGIIAVVLSVAWIIFICAMGYGIYLAFLELLAEMDSNLSLAHLLI